MDKDEEAEGGYAPQVAKDEEAGSCATITGNAEEAS